MDVGDTAVTSSLNISGLALKKSDAIDDTVSVVQKPVGPATQTLSGLGAFTTSNDGKTFFLSTNTGSLAQSSLESQLGIANGILDGTLSGTKNATNATEGSAVKGTFAAKAGDVLTFDYFWDGGDYLPYDDFSFVTVNGKALKLTSITDNGNYGDKSGIFQYTIQAADIINGVVNVGVGLVDVGDTSVTSSLAIKDLVVKPAALIDKVVDVAPTAPLSAATTSITTAGQVSSSGSGLTTAFALNTGGSAVLQSNLEATLGLTLDTLDNTGSGNATEGSGISGTFAAKAGDVLTFDYFFDGGDYIPFNDFAFVAINGVATKLTSIADNGNYGDKAGIFQYTIKASDIVDGVIKAAVGIVDVGDSAVTSALNISGFAIKPLGLVDTKIDVVQAPTTAGSNVVTSYGKVTKSGTDTFSLSTDSGSVVQAALESSLGLSSGKLDNTGNGNATEGSAVKATYAVKAGDFLTFDYFFDGGDYIPYNDFAFVSINGNVQSFASISENGNYGDEAGVFKYQVKDSDIKSDGTVTISVGVMDVGDKASTSYLNISGLAIKTIDTLDDSNELTQTPNITSSAATKLLLDSLKLGTKVEYISDPITGQKNLYDPDKSLLEQSGWAVKSVAAGYGGSAADEIIFFTNGLTTGSVKGGAGMDIFAPTLKLTNSALGQQKIIGIDTSPGYMKIEDFEKGVDCVYVPKPYEGWGAGITISQSGSNALISKGQDLIAIISNNQSGSLKATDTPIGWIIS